MNPGLGKRLSCRTLGPTSCGVHTHTQEKRRRRKWRRKRRRRRSDPHELLELCPDSPNMIPAFLCCFSNQSIKGLLCGSCSSVCYCRLSFLSVCSCSCSQPLARLLLLSFTRRSSGFSPNSLFPPVLCTLSCQVGSFYGN